uniref:Uncharacterized protein n=1 Tax=Oryza punctata TaxID=4537 RepID=A0A0E0LB92_ORYPU
MAIVVPGGCQLHVVLASGAWLRAYRQSPSARALAEGCEKGHVGVARLSPPLLGPDGRRSPATACGSSWRKMRRQSAKSNGPPKRSPPGRMSLGEARQEHPKVLYCTSDAFGLLFKIGEA